LSKLLEKK